MKILILGASGMLGSTIYKFFENKPSYDIIFYKRSISNYNGFFNSSFERNNNMPSLIDKIEKIVEVENPDFIINCIGIIKQIKDTNDSILNIEINSLLPHKIAKLSDIYGFKFIHFSTDCVFSGKKGNYNDHDIKDAYDLYGISKGLGEVINCKNTLTFRTSIIGNELKTHKSLLDWFLHNKDKIVEGYTNAYFSGFTTLEVAKILEIIFRNNFSPGLYNVCLLYTSDAATICSV